KADAPVDRGVSHRVAAPGSTICGYLFEVDLAQRHVAEMLDQRLQPQPLAAHCAPTLVDRQQLVEVALRPLTERDSLSRVFLLLLLTLQRDAQLLVFVQLDTDSRLIEVAQP